MANKKVAPDRGKQSATKEAGESALQLALPGTRRRVPPSAPDGAENPPPAPAKNTDSASSKNKPTAPSKNTASASSKNKPTAPAKNKPTAPAKNKPPVPDKTKASSSASDGGEVPAPPQDTALRRFIYFLCEKAASMPWRGLLDAFLTWVHSRSTAGGKAQAEAPTKGSGHQEQREKNSQQQASPQLPEEHAGHRKGHDCDKIEADGSVPTDLLISQHGRDFDEAEADGTIPAGPSISKVQAEAPTEGSAHQEQKEKNTRQQASPQLPEEHTGHRKGHDCDKIEADGSVPTDLLISQHGRDFDEAEADGIIPAGPSDFDEAEADRVIPAGPSISKIVEDYEKFDPYLSSDIHKEFIKIMSSCPPGKEVCTFCYFEKDVKTQRSQSNRISHVSNWHARLAGVKCTNCPARFPTEHVRDLHHMHCNA